MKNEEFARVTEDTKNAMERLFKLNIVTKTIKDHTGFPEFILILIDIARKCTRIRPSQAGR